MVYKIIKSRATLFIVLWGLLGTWCLALRLDPVIASEFRYWVGYPERASSTSAKEEPGCFVFEPSR